MAEILLAKRLPLPTLGHTTQRRLFERLVSPDNLVEAADTSRPVNERLQQYVRISNSSGEILSLYGRALKDGEHVGSEGARLLGFSLRLSQALLGLMDEFFPTLPRDATYLARLIGREQMKLGILQQVAGVVASLGETETYTPADRAFMLSELAATLPKLKHVCSDEFRDELQRELFGVRSLFTAPDELKRLDGARTELDTR